MVQSPSWEANWFAASQQIPRISRNPKVHYRTHKRPPPLSILGQLNPAHIPLSHLLEINLNVHHLRLGLPSGLLTSGFPTKTLYTPLSSPIRTTCPAYLILLDFITRTILGESTTYINRCCYIQKLFLAVTLGHLRTYVPLLSPSASVRNYYKVWQ